MISAPLIEYLKKGIFTILGLMLAVYLFVILLTYTGNDPSWSHISSDMTTINNMGGAMGAWLSDLLYSFFGFGAWWLLAFLVYESILIWWDNKPTFWLLRLVAYVFLMLSGSALFAQLVALVQQVTNPIATGLTGVAGGIIGLELQARLAQLLSQWGSVAFLSVFVLITTTFAFNIHWQLVYRKLSRLAWLGSGLKSKDKSENNIAVPQQDSAVLAATDTNNIDPNLQQNKAYRNKEGNGQDYGQLPLELQPAPQTAATSSDNSGRFSGVLTEFLAKSGLGASTQAIITAEAEAEAEAEAQAQAQAQAKRDTQAIADKLVINETLGNVVMADGIVDVMVDTTIDNSIFESKAVPSSVDELADAWLVEHDPNVAAVAASTAEQVSEQRTLKQHTVEENISSNVCSEAPLSEIKAAETEAAETEAAEIKVAEVQALTSAAVAAANETIAIDMTPTNTPAANPKAAPMAVATPILTATPVSESTATAKTLSITPAITSASVGTTTAFKPTIRFEIPAGDSSNHITDMMPDHDASYTDDSSDPSLLAHTMPAIHDDAAFAQRSRSMQTAEYRSSLTAIPELSILDKPDPNREPSYTIAELEQLSELLEIKLQEFNVKAQVVNAIPGPVVTRFEVELAAGIKASKVTGISRDLARSLSMASLRVVEVIPGKPYIGIEVPNKQREMVRLIELLDTEKFRDPKAQISMAMGKDIGGKPIITDLARAPHMLVAGTTGSGKSVLVNSMLLSMLLKYTPNELRMILIDPKQLELANYNDIPHLLTPVVTDMTEAASSLSWCVAEMERRYQLMSLLKVRKLSDFNKKVRAAEQAGKPMLDPLWRPNDNVSISQAPKLKTLPMIVIVADEFADMIMQVGKQAEELITRLAQKSRAAGIHLILATQRPSVDVITGLIKANIPVRAALRVNSKVDSRTILDSGGAEDMLGNGDMLFLGPGQIEPDRVHGAYVSDEEVNSVCDAWRARGAPDYIDNMAGNFELSSSGSSTANASGEDDELYNEAVGFIMETRKVSASSIQRKFSIGYNRAARIVDSMEEAGLVSSMGKSGKRELLM